MGRLRLSAPFLNSRIGCVMNKLKHRVIRANLISIQKVMESVNVQDKTNYHYSVVYQVGDKYDMKRIPGMWLEDNPQLVEELENAKWVLSQKGQFEVVLRLNDYKGHTNLNGIRPAQGARQQIIRDAQSLITEMGCDKSEETLDKLWTILSYLKNR